MTFEAPPTHVRKPRMRQMPSEPFATTKTFVCQDLQGRAIGFGASQREAYYSWKRLADYMDRIFKQVDGLSSNSYREPPGTRHGGT